MDIKEKQAFDEYFKQKYPELYKDVLNEDGDERAIIGYSFALSAWQAAKAQAVPEGYVMVPKCLYCNGYGEVGCRFEGTFTCPECNGDRINLKAMIEAQEQSHA